MRRVCPPLKVKQKNVMSWLVLPRSGAVWAHSEMCVRVFICVFLCLLRITLNLLFPVRNKNKSVPGVSASVLHQKISALFLFLRHFKWKCLLKTFFMCRHFSPLLLFMIYLKQQELAYFTDVRFECSSAIITTSLFNADIKRSDKQTCSR